MVALFSGKRLFVQVEYKLRSYCKQVSGGNGQPLNENADERLALYSSESLGIHEKTY